MKPSSSQMANTMNSYELTDTHCHLDLDPLFLQLDEILMSARLAGVTRFIIPGIHPGGWGRMAQLASHHPGVYAAFGIHPLHADQANDDTLARLAQIARNGTAIGEIGLDVTTEKIEQLQQETTFREQLRLAVQLGLPVLIHCRRAFQRTLRILREEKAHHVGGIMHAFSGSLDMAREFIRCGMLISLCGTVTWEGAVRPLRLACEIQLENLVLETDAPDLPPQNYRGQVNQPAYLGEILTALAELRGISAAAAAAATTANAIRLMGLSADK